MTSMPTSPGQGDQLSTRAQLQELIGSMRVTQLIYVAATLGIADQLTDGPRSIAELASTATVDPQALYRVLRALASHGVFAETGDCHFALTPQATLLRADVPGSLRAYAMMLGGRAFGSHGERCSSACRRGHKILSSRHYRSSQGAQEAFPTVGCQT